MVLALEAGLWRGYRPWFSLSLCRAILKTLAQGTKVWAMAAIHRNARNPKTLQEHPRIGITACEPPQDNGNPWYLGARPASSRLSRISSWSLRRHFFARRKLHAYEMLHMVAMDVMLSFHMRSSAYGTLRTAQGHRAHGAAVETSGEPACLQAFFTRRLAVLIISKLEHTSRLKVFLGLRLPRQSCNFTATKKPSDFTEDSKLTAPTRSCSENSNVGTAMLRRNLGDQAQFIAKLQAKIKSCKSKDPAEPRQGGHVVS